MHLFFNDPRVAYVTRHRRIGRHSLMALVAGGVGVAALGVAIGAAGWEPPQQGRPAPQPAHQGRSAPQPGMVTPDPVQDVNLYGVPAAPQPALDLVQPPRTLAAPAQPQQPATTARAQVRQVEKAKAPRAAPPATAAPTGEPTTAPTTQPPATPEPTVEPPPAPTLEPTLQPTQGPAVEPAQEPAQGTAVEPIHEPTARQPGWHHRGPGGWPWEQAQGAP